MFVSMFLERTDKGEDPTRTWMVPSHNLGTWTKKKGEKKTVRLFPGFTSLLLSTMQWGAAFPLPWGSAQDHGDKPSENNPSETMSQNKQHSADCFGYNNAKVTEVGSQSSTHTSPASHTVWPLGTEPFSYMSEKEPPVVDCSGSFAGFVVPGPVSDFVL